MGYYNDMALKNEYVEIIRRFRKLPDNTRNEMLRDVTANQMTPNLEDALLNIRSVPGVGDVTGRAILFAIGINLE